MVNFTILGTAGRPSKVQTLILGITIVLHFLCFSYLNLTSWIKIMVSQTSLKSLTFHLIDLEKKKRKHFTKKIILIDYLCKILFFRKSKIFYIVN